MMRTLLGTMLMVTMGAGCTTVQRQSQRAGVVVATTGDRIEAGVNTVAVRTRSWWSRTFDRDGSAAERSRRKAAARKTGSSGRYEIVEPQYVGASDPGAAR